MNKEQFDRAVAISDRIRELNETKEEIRKKSEVGSKANLRLQKW